MFIQTYFNDISIKIFKTFTIETVWRTIILMNENMESALVSPTN